MNAQDQIHELAESIGVDASSVRWLAEYIIRQTPEGHDDLLTDSDWIKSCAGDWLRMNKRMTAEAIRNPSKVAQIFNAIS